MKLAKIVPVKHTNPNDGIGRGVDFALVLLAFFGVGYALDRVLGTKPVLMIAMVVLAIVGETARLYYAYAAHMKQLEADRAAAARGDRR